MCLISCTGPAAEGMIINSKLSSPYSQRHSLIAIMLGRLEMSVAQCKENFVRNADELFNHPRSLLRFMPSQFYSKYDDKRIVRATQLLLDKFDPVSKASKADRWRRTIFASPKVRTKTQVN
jgi:hypothetical protein